MSRLYPILLMIFIPFQGMVQSSSIFGTTSVNEYALGITADNNGNIYMAASNNNKGWLIKRDPQNNVMWSYLIQESSDAEISFIDVIGDTVFGCGWLKSGNQILGGIFFKMNATTGVPYWIKAEQTSRTYFAAMSYANGKYFLTGSEVNGTTGYNGKICAVSSLNGATVWETPSTGLTFPPYTVDYVDDLLSSSDMVNGKMFITGRSYVGSGAVFDMRILLIGISETGTIFLTKYLLFDISTNFINRFYGMGVEYDGADSLVIANFGDTDCANCTDYLSGIVKTDLNGNVGWAKYYSLPGYGYESMIVRGIHVTPNNYVIYGTLDHNLPSSEIFMLKTDKNGVCHPNDVLIMGDPNYIGSTSAKSGPWNTGGSSCYRNGKHYFCGNYTNGTNMDALQVIVDETLYDGNSCMTMSYPASIGNHAYIPFSGNLNKVDHPGSIAFSNSGQLTNYTFTTPCAPVITFSQVAICGSTQVTAYANGFVNPVFTWSNGFVGPTITITAPGPISVSVTHVTQPPDCCTGYGEVTPIFVSGAESTSIAASICETETYNFGGNVLDQAGVYTDTILTNMGCDSIITLTLNVRPYVYVAYSATICQGDTYPFNGSLLSQPGIYTDTLATSCDSIVTLTLSVIPNSFLSMADTICEGESFTLGAGIYMVSGNYTETFPSAAGCDSIVSLALFVIPLQYCVMEETICSGEDFMFAGIPYTHPGTYIHHFPTSTCDSIVTLHLNVVEPYVDIHFFAYETDEGIFVQLNALSTMSPLSYFWTSSANLSSYAISNPQTMIHEAAWMYLMVTDSNGCTATDELQVTIPVVSTLYIPNAFTPDGGEFNQVFKIYGTHITQFEFAVYDRWGALIFETMDINYGWDGTYQGKILQDGTYTYKVHAIGADHVTYDKTGHMSLLK